MNQQIREALDKVEDVLLEGDTDAAHEMWDILTGLRGPDDGDEFGKNNMTAYIREAAFPRVAALARPIYSKKYYNGFRIGKVTEGSNPRFNQDHWYDHFESHARRAAHALDLSPEAVTVEDTK